MLLHDRVTIVLKADGSVVEANVPAQFGHGASTREVERGTVYVEGARVILAPTVNFNPDVHALHVRGETWVAEGQPMVRTRRSRVHHVTVPVARSTVGS